MALNSVKTGLNESYLCTVKIINDAHEGNCIHEIWATGSSSAKGG